MSINELRDFLDAKSAQYNRPEFIDKDPICIPHRFKRVQDIEIMGFWASILAWGQRKTIINKCTDLVERMDGAPYDFIMNHQEADLKSMLGFKHRTFNDTDALYFVEFFKQHYQRYPSLEDAFIIKNDPAIAGIRPEFVDILTSSAHDIELSSSPCFIGEQILPGQSNIVERALNDFRNYFFSLPDYPIRTRKHISSPTQKSACKRLNMFLRWMVRKDKQGVDFGIWNRISPAELICPADVHVERVARKLGLIKRKAMDWQAAVELTEALRELDPSDPVKYDFALFGLGIEEQYQNNI